MIRSVSKPSSNAFKLAFMIGSFLFAINHGTALVRNEMTLHRWVSVALGYAVPFATSVYCPCSQCPSTSQSSHLLSGRLAQEENHGSSH